MSTNKGLEPIKEKKYLNLQDWQKIKTKLPSLKYFDDCISDSLLETNTRIIKKACNKLHIECEIVSDWPTQLTKTERLLEICTTLGATKYLSGISGKNYLDLKLFEEKGIEVIFQDETKMIKKSLVEFI